MSSKQYQKIIFLIQTLVFVFISNSAFAYHLVVNDENQGSFLTVTAHDNDLVFPLWDEDPASSTWILDINGTTITPSESGWLRNYRKTNGIYKLKYSNRTFSFETDMVVSSTEQHILITGTFTNNSSDKV
ncbi:MAG: hypothetical protein KAH21_13545, partial [Spirochaetaceae bacterium]|nr:hypothetical protein [Spirochaetaceae bacterium]